MKKSKTSSAMFFVFIVVSLYTTFAIISSVEARKHHGHGGHNNKNKNKPHHKLPKQKRGNTRNVPVPSPAPTYPTDSTVFNVLSFGAKGDGISDDSTETGTRQALVAAWKAACGSVAGAKVEIPAEFRFMIRPITLQGPCVPDLVLQIDGTLLAPSDVGEWPKSSLFQWLNFKWVDNFTIQGSGKIDGQGSNWWIPNQVYYIQKKAKRNPDVKPTAVRFYSCYNVTVRDIEIANSPQCHLKFDNSGDIKVDNITISSPENSINTDGIHLQNTKDVEIHHSNIGCGDDCISIQTGSSNIHVHDINCGPGHGISLGGLGKDKSVACVSNIIVENVSLQNTLAGVRIKTWQGGIGSVKNVSFSKIQVSDVKYPIIIDQFYCDKKFCKNQTQAVAISGVRYDHIIGTYSVQPIHLACSTDVPCIDVDLIDIQLKPVVGFRGLRQGLCWNSYGKSQAPLVPSSIDCCLRRDTTGSVKRTAKSHHEHVCYLS